MGYEKIVILKDSGISTIENLHKFNVSTDDNVKTDNYRRGVFSCGMGEFFENKLTSEVLTDSIDPNVLYCYTLEPFGGLGNFLGMNDFYPDSFFSKIDKIVIDAIQRIGNVYLMILWPHECDISSGELSFIHTKLKLSNIPIDKVIFVMNRTWSLDATYDRTILNKNNNDSFTHMQNDPKMIITYFDYFPFYKGNEARINKFYESESINDEYIYSYEDLVKKREHKILCLNRRLINRWHRMLFLLLMYHHDTIDLNTTSYDMDFEGHDSPHWGSTLLIGSNHYLGIDENQLKNIWNAVKINRPRNLLDKKDMLRVLGFGNESPELYMNTYFSLVTETMFFENVDFITEKSFKPLCHYHPFILLGRPGSLRNLKSLGFKTFDKWIDESYDDEYNNMARFRKVFDVYLMIHHMDSTELHNMYLDMMPILRHNYELMLEYGDNFRNSYYELEEKILNSVVNHER